MRAHRGWSKWLGIFGSKKQKSSSGNRRRLSLPRLEALEDRKLMAVLDVAAIVASETNSTVDFQVTRTGDLSGAATVEYRTLPGTALEGADYVAVNNTLTFLAGESLKTVTVPLTLDAVFEPSESFTLQLYDAQGATIVSQFGVATVRDDDGILVVGAEAGQQPRVQVYDAENGNLMYDFLAYDKAFRGGVRVASGDVTGDGVPDIITAAGAGGGPQVRVFDMSQGGESPQRIASFFAFDKSYTGGVMVSVGDMNADGHADIVAAASGDNTLANPVKTFSGSNLSTVLWQFDPFNDFVYTGGVQIAAGDVTGDGRIEVIAGTTRGTSAQVRVFDLESQAPAVPILNIKPYGAFSGGVYVGAGDLDGDGKADIITGPGKGGGPDVRAYRGVDGLLLQKFKAYDASFTGGVRVSGGDFDGDGVSEIVTAPGPGGGADVKVRNAQTLAIVTKTSAFDVVNYRAGALIGAAGSRAREGIEIMDDSDADFQGDWFSSPTGGFTRDSHYIEAGNATATATWSFDNLTPGLYRISTTWTAHGTRPTDATYTLTSGPDLLGIFQVNQEQSADDVYDAGMWWEDFGGLGHTFWVSGTSLDVQLSGGANDFVSADAVRIERVTFPNEAPTIDPPASDIILPNSVYTGVFTVGDSRTFASELKVTATSSNQALISDIKIFGTGANRSIVIKPADDTVGRATITLTVTDDEGKSASTSFVLVVESSYRALDPGLNGAIGA